MYVRFGSAVTHVRHRTQTFNVRLILFSRTAWRAVRFCRRQTGQCEQRI